MTFKDLQYLLALADTGSFRQAAEACGIAQPTLSVQLAKLEAELNCTLFERGRRGAQPTAMGEAVVAQARKVLTEVQALKDLCLHQAHPLAGPFRLGLIPTVGPYLMPDVLPALRKAFAQTEFLLREDVTPHLIERLKKSELDAAVLSQPVHEPALAMFDFHVETLHVIAPTDHALASQEQVAPAQLNQHRLLMLEDGHCLRDQTLAACLLTPNDQSVQATTVESLRQMVAAGIGVTVLPEMAVRGRFARVAGVVVRPLEHQPTRTLTLATRQSHPALGAIRELAQLLGQALLKR